MKVVHFAYDSNDALTVLYDSGAIWKRHQDAVTLKWSWIRLVMPDTREQIETIYPTNPNE